MNGMNRQEVNAAGAEEFMKEVSGNGREVWMEDGIVHVGIEGFDVSVKAGPIEEMAAAFHHEVSLFGCRPRWEPDVPFNVTHAYNALARSLNQYCCRKNIQ